MRRLLNHPKFVEYTPFATTGLLEGANVQQLWRMWTEKTAAGQSLTAWISVCIALLLWANVYRAQRMKTALYATLLGVLMNLLVVATVVYWRFLA